MTEPQDDDCIDERGENYGDDHRYELVESRDGVSTYLCPRCGAETWEDDED